MADDKVQKLIGEVAKRKKEIADIGSYSYKTNMQLSIGGQTKNLQTLNLEDLLSAYAQMSLVVQEATRLAKLHSVDYKPSLSGFAWDKWEQDIEHRLKKLSLSKRQSELDKLEERLNKLISPELRAKLELEAIEKELGL